MRALALFSPLTSHHITSLCGSPRPQERGLAFASAAQSLGLGSYPDAACGASPSVRALARVVPGGEAGGLAGDGGGDALLLEGLPPGPGAGVRLRLAAQRLAGWPCLYPGQIVALSGANPTGFALDADSLLAAAPGLRPGGGATAAAAEGGDAEMESGGSGGGEAAARPLTLVVACGPLGPVTHAGAPPRALAGLIAACDAARPDVLVVCGPFGEDGARARHGGPF